MLVYMLLTTVCVVPRVVVNFHVVRTIFCSSFRVIWFPKQPSEIKNLMVIISTTVFLTISHLQSALLFFTSGNFFTLLRTFRFVSCAKDLFH